MRKGLTVEEISQEFEIDVDFVKKAIAFYNGYHLYDEIPDTKDGWKTVAKLLLAFVSKKMVFAMTKAKLNYHDKEIESNDLTSNDLKKIWYMPKEILDLTQNCLKGDKNLDRDMLEKNILCMKENTEKLLRGSV